MKRYLASLVIAAATALCACLPPPIKLLVTSDDFALSRASNDAIRATIAPAAVDTSVAAGLSADMRPAPTAERSQDDSGTAVVSFDALPSGESGGSTQGTNRAIPQSTAEQMLAASNAMRYAAGRYGQHLDQRLCAAAQEQAAHLAATGYPYSRNDSGHYWGNGDCLTRAQRHGFHVGRVSEVIAPGFRGFTIPEAFTAWRGSASHYSAVLSGNDVCGFGYAPGRNGMDVYVGLYGTESSAPAPAAERTYDRPARVALSAPAAQQCVAGVCFQPATARQSYRAPASTGGSFSQPASIAPSYQRRAFLPWRRK